MANFRGLTPDKKSCWVKRITVLSSLAGLYYQKLHKPSDPLLEQRRLILESYDEMWSSTPLHFGPFFSLDICCITDEYMMEWFRSRTRIWHRACATGFRCCDYPSHCQQWGRLCGAFLRGFSQDFGFCCIGCWNFPQRRGKVKRTVMEFGGIRKKALNRLVASSWSFKRCFKDFNWWVWPSLEAKRAKGHNVWPIYTNSTSFTRSSNYFISIYGL